MDDEKEIRDDKERDHKKPHFEPMLSQNKAQGQGEAGQKAFLQETLKTLVPYIIE
jgi:hypothetical protein